MTIYCLYNIVIIFTKSRLANRDSDFTATTALDSNEQDQTDPLCWSGRENSDRVCMHYIKSDVCQLIT